MSKRPNSKSSILKYSLLLATALSSPLTYATTSMIKFDNKTGRSIEIDRSIVNGAREDKTNPSFQDGDDLQLSFKSNQSEILFRASNATIGKIAGFGRVTSNFVLENELPFDKSESGTFKIEGYNVALVGKIGRIDVLQLGTTMKDSTIALDADTQTVTIIKPDQVNDLVMAVNAIQLDKFNKIEFNTCNTPEGEEIVIALADGVYSSDATDRGSIIFATSPNRGITFNGAIGQMDAGQHNLAILETSGEGSVMLKNGLRKDGSNNATAIAINVETANFEAANTHITHNSFDVAGNMKIGNAATVDLQSATATIHNLIVEGAGKFNLQPNAVSSNNQTIVQSLTMTDDSTISVKKDVTLDLQVDNPKFGKLDIADNGIVKLRNNGTSLGIKELTLRGAKLELPSSNNPAITTLNVVNGATNTSTLTDAKSIGDINITDAILGIAGTGIPDLTGTVKVSGASQLIGTALDKIPALILSDASTFALPTKSDGTFIPVGDLQVKPGVATLTQSGDITKLAVDGSQLTLNGTRPEITELMVHGKNGSPSSIIGAKSIKDITLNAAALELPVTGDPDIETPIIGKVTAEAGTSTLTNAIAIQDLVLNGSTLRFINTTPRIINLVASHSTNASTVSTLHNAGKIDNITLRGATLKLNVGILNLTVATSSSLLGTYNIPSAVTWTVESGADLQLSSIAGLANVNFDYQGAGGKGCLMLNNDVTFTATDTIADAVTSAPSAIVMVGDKTFTIGDNVKVNVQKIMPDHGNQGTVVIGNNVPLPQLGDFSGSNNLYFKNVVFNDNIKLGSSSKIYADEITAKGELDINGINNDTINTKKIVLGDLGKVKISTDDIIKLVGTDIYPENSARGVVEINGSDRNMLGFKPIIGNNLHVLGELTLSDLRADLDGARFHVNNLNINNSNIELLGEVNLGDANFNDVDLNLKRNNINADTIKFSGNNIIQTFVEVDGRGNVVDNGKIIATGAINADPSSVIDVVISSNDIAHIPAGTTINIFEGAIVPGNTAPGTINAPINSVTAAPRTAVASAAAGKVEFSEQPIPDPIVAPPVTPPVMPRVTSPVTPPVLPYLTIHPVSGNTPFSIPRVVDNRAGDNSGNITIKFYTDHAKTDEAVQAFTSAIADSRAKEVIEFIGHNIDAYPRGGNILSAVLAAKNDATALKEMASSLDDIKQDKKSVDDLGRFVFEELPDTLPLFTSQQQPVASGDGDGARVWTKFVGREADQGKTSGLAGYDGKFYGVMLGISKNVSNNLSLGAAIGGVSADFAYKGDNAANKLNTGSKVAYIYGDYRSCGQKMFLQTLLSYSRTNIDSSHARGKDGIAIGQHSADTFGGLAKLGYVFDIAHSLNFTPTIGLIKHYTKEQGYTETGAANWNFMVDADAARNSAVFTLGASLAAKTAGRSILPEVHFNMYKPLQHSADEAEFGFDWLKEKHFAAGRIAPQTSFNVGGKAKTHIRDLDVELGIDLYFNSNSYISRQGYLGIKIDF